MLAISYAITVPMPKHPPHPDKPVESDRAYSKTDGGADDSNTLLNNDLMWCEVVILGQRASKPTPRQGEVKFHRSCNCRER